MRFFHGMTEIETPSATEMPLQIRRNTSPRPIPWDAIAWEIDG